VILLTLVIAAPSKDFLVLGADSRGVLDSGDARIEINILKKLIPVTKHVAILMYGGAEEATQLIEKYKSNLEKNEKTIDGVSLVAEDFCKFCRDEERKLVGLPFYEENIEYFGFLVCGMDKIGESFSKPLIYILSNYNGFRLGLCRPYAIQGKPIIGLYRFSKYFHEDMTANELCQLVAQSIYDTMCIDGDVGGQINIAIIDSDGMRELSDPDVNKLYETWQLTKLRRIME
jgi:20S proteasome alpha/beta subunit